jgi:hypothetical protein
MWLPIDLLTGQVALDSTDVTIVGYFQGMPVNASGSVPCDIGGTVAVLSGGFPFTSAGLLAVEEAAPASYSNGLPYTASGRLAVSSSGSTSFSNGLPFVGGALSASGLTPGVADYLLDRLGNNLTTRAGDQLTYR